MHVLLLPSEEFVPARNHLLGIFQFHQGLALAGGGHKVGALSIRQSLSIPMIVKAGLRRLMGRDSPNELAGASLFKAGSILFDKLFRLERFTTSQSVGPIAVVRTDGFYVLPANWRVNPWLTRAWLQAGMTAYKRYVSEQGVPDLIHAHNGLNAGLLARILQKRFGIPYLLTEHSSQLAAGKLAPALKPPLAEAYRQAAEVFVVSRALGDSLVSLLGSEMPKWEVLPNILDPEFQAAPWNELSAGQGTFTFLHVASLLPVKSQDVLLKGFAQAFGGREEVRLVIAGDGILEPQLRQLVADLGLSRQVDFVGRKTRNEILELMDRSQCCVLSSQTETFGVVLIEALSRGLPLVSTDCGGPRTIIRPENGLLCRIGSPESLAEALKALQSDYLKYERGAIREDALRRFGCENFVRTLTEKYVGALQRCGRPLSPMQP